MVCHLFIKNIVLHYVSLFFSVAQTFSSQIQKADTTQHNERKKNSPQISRHHISVSEVKGAAKRSLPDIYCSQRLLGLITIYHPWDNRDIPAI